MIRVITITDQYGSGGSELARRIAQELGWKLLDRGLVERAARVADLAETAECFDHEAGRWCDVLRARGIRLDELCPRVAPRWFGEIDNESIHALSAQLICAAAELGECVIAVPGAQCLLQGHSNVLNVLVYASVEERAARVRHRDPGCADVQALLRQTDSETAKYVLEHYESEWFGAWLCLYDICVNTSTGLDAAATLIEAKRMFMKASCTPASKEFSPCHPQHQL